MFSKKMKKRCMNSSGCIAVPGRTKVFNALSNHTLTHIVASINTVTLTRYWHQHRISATSPYQCFIQQLVLKRQLLFLSAQQLHQLVVTLSKFQSKRHKIILFRHSQVSMLGNGCTDSYKRISLNRFFWVNYL